MGWWRSWRSRRRVRAQGRVLPESPFCDVLTKLGRFDEARAESEWAASLTRNARERAVFLERAVAFAGDTATGR